MNMRSVLIAVVFVGIGLLCAPLAIAGKGGDKGKPGGGGGEDPAPTLKRVAVTGWEVKGGSNTDFASLHTVNADGSSLTRLTSGSQWADPDWSPDGRFIAARVANVAIVLHDVDGGSQVSLSHEAAHPSWSRRLDASGSVLAAESQYIAASRSHDLEIHRPFAASGPEYVALLSLNGYGNSDPAEFVVEVEWLPQHAAADERSWILFRRTIAGSTDTTSGGPAKLMMVEVDTSAWPVQIVTGPIEATWAETAYPPGVSDDGMWACWTSSDRSELRIAALQWNTATGSFEGIGTAASFGNSAFSGYQDVREWGVGLNSDGSRAAVWAARSNGGRDLVMLDVDGGNVESVGPGTKKRGISAYGLRTSWEP